MLCSNSNASVNGSTPTGNLSQLYGKASTLEFSYSPSDTVHVGTANIGSSTGHNADSLAFIERSATRARRLHRALRSTSRVR